MRALLRLGDANTAGGIILRGDPTVLVNGRPVATIASAVSQHPPCGRKGGELHCFARTSALGNPDILINNKPALLTGSKDSCGHLRQRGSPDVSAG